ncbi:endonuclease V [Bacillus sp. DX4.1]|uniref:endonuclease V n=1 Tax=Bacillus sp. DX4.1 TaxID=3055867 RepID=UPI0025A0CD40|nr:endonuclease V [Bacillus sp. DX4.1]MDM5186427.1 endonuclease V [Bacillus sp. DX4.1]
MKNDFHLEDVSLIAGVDLAYWEKDDKHYGTCCIVVIDYHTKEEVEKVYSYGEVTVPLVTFPSLSSLSVPLTLLTRPPEDEEDWNF